MKSMTVLKHVVSCLDCHEDVCRSLKWQGHAAGIFHKYPSVSAMETLVEVYTDSDWACDKSTRRSVSCATIFWGCCLLYSSSRTQKLVSLSSGEAEVYSCSSGASDSILLTRLVAWMTGFRVVTVLHTDSSATRGILLRQGVGRVRHHSCRILWLQDHINGGHMRLVAIAGSLNPADIGTKRLPCGSLKSLMALLGMFNTTAAQKIPVAFSKRNILGLTSLISLKGCDEDTTSNPSQMLVILR